MEGAFVGVGTEDVREAFSHAGAPSGRRRRQRLGCVRSKALEDELYRVFFLGCNVCRSSRGRGV
ncbi:hypothetical protein CGQ17_23820, partial [Enterobacter cloacae]